MFNLQDLRKAFDAGANLVNTPTASPDEAFNLFFLSLDLPKPEAEEKPETGKTETI